MKVFFNAIIVQIFFNIYIYRKSLRLLPPKKAYKISLAALFGLEFFVYISAYLFYKYLPIDLLHTMLIIGTSWTILVMYFTGFLLFYDLVCWIGRKKNKDWHMKLESFGFRVMYFIVSLILVASMMLNGNYRFWHPVVNEMNLTIAKNTPNVKHLKVVMVADLHVGYLINRKVLNMYVNKIMEQKPDIILIVGDVIDYDLRPLQEEHMDEEFRRLRAPYGVFFSTGNHEYRLNAEEKIKWLSDKAGFTVLRDSVVKVANSFYVIGREDDLAPKRLSLSDIMKKYSVDNSLPTLVMNHEPKKLEEESNQKIDLAVFGHTHNGQLFPYNWVISMLFEVGHGYKKKDDTNIYVTSGLGLSGPHYRIGTISEIVVLNLTFKQ